MLCATRWFISRTRKPWPSRRLLKFGTKKHHRADSKSGIRLGHFRSQNAFLHGRDVCHAGAVLHFSPRVFEKLGGYRHAYLTEDMEMAMRMQANHYKMVNSHNTIVYTVAPDALRKLYKQRLRWTYGFIKNAMDYKHLYFNSEYGNLGIFVLPMATISIFSAIYVLLMTVFSFLRSVFHELVKSTPLACTGRHGTLTGLLSTPDSSLSFPCWHFWAPF